MREGKEFEVPAAVQSGRKKARSALPNALFSCRVRVHTLLTTLSSHSTVDLLYKQRYGGHPKGVAYIKQSLLPEGPDIGVVQTEPEKPLLVTRDRLNRSLL